MSGELGAGRAEVASRAVRLVVVRTVAVLARCAPLTSISDFAVTSASLSLHAWWARVLMDGSSDLISATAPVSCRAIVPVASISGALGGTD